MDAAVAPVRAAAAALYTEAESFRPLLSATDPLAVEVHTAQLMADLHREYNLDPLGLALGVMTLARQRPEPHVAAMTAAVYHFQPGMATGMALDDLARRGVGMPAWRERLGEVTPGRAWRYRDLFGDQEALLVSFCYDGGAEHGIVVETTTCPEPGVRVVHLSTTIEELHAVLRASADGAGGQLVMEEITLAQAAARLAGPVRRPHRQARPEDLVFLPIVRGRVERLPEPDPAREDRYTRVDRAAAVEAFLTETTRTSDVDGEVLRFWAEVLAGYTATNGSSPARGSSPTRVGPAWLGYLLGEHVPRTFELTTEQRAGLAPAVAAWSRWAAHQQDLPDAAADRLVARVVEIDQKFDTAYADLDLVPTRCYLSDVAAVTRDGEDLWRALALRSHAVPLPARRSPAARSLLASDPAQRRRILAAELEAWGLAPDLSTEDWFEALTSISEQLWNEDPPELAQAVVRYLQAAGTDDGLLGDLTELAVDQLGDATGFLKAAYARLEPIPEL
jgi:hypothetical protein